MEARGLIAGNRERFIIAAAFVGLAVAIVLRAWVSEDAYITFRVIDNFMNGYGLRWNIHERVQAYTHPLWLLLHIPVYAVWNNLFHVSIAISVACTMAAVGVALATVQRQTLIALACFLLPLALSKSFVDYATSGLENPLSYLLFAAFGYVLIRKHEHPHFWFWCSLTLSLALFNRLDAITLYAVPLIYLLKRPPQPVSWRQVVLGALPLISWEYFSLLYYGFVFPNTKHAKLGTDLDTMLYLEQGMRYLKYLLIKDTAGAIVLASSLAFIFFPQKFGHAAPRGLPYLPAALALGVLCHCLYVIYVGGDYMMGRFWAFPIFVSAWLWYIFCPRRLRLDVVFLIACTLGGAYMLPPLFDDIRKNCKECITLRGRVLDGIHTFGLNRLVISTHPFKIRKQGHYPFAKAGRKLGRENPPPVKPMWYIGMIGFYAGPKVIIVDQLGLADPLLARLPAVKRQGFYVGHFRREIPRGYIHALKTHSLERMPPRLGQYYDKLRLITEGNLLDRERLKTILLFNIGYYDRWKYEFLGYGRR